MDDIKLWHGDCLELLKKIPDQSVDLILTDPPYGTTACSSDIIIPFKEMWNELKRILKINGTICLFGNAPFSSYLRISNIEMFKYDWIILKNRITGHLNAKKMPMRDYEICSIFQNKINYHPQIEDKDPSNIRKHNESADRNSDCYRYMGKSKRSIPENKTYPRMTSVPKLKKIFKPLHPTEKSINSLDYLIKTYTTVNQIVVDFAMGSGSTGVSAKKLNRKFIGIELEEKYFNIAKQRINEDSI